MMKKAIISLRNRAALVCSNIKGQAMAEYGLLLAFIAVLVLVVLIVLGPKIAGVFTSVDHAIDQATPIPAAP